VHPPLVVSSLSHPKFDSHFRLGSSTAFLVGDCQFESDIFTPLDKSAFWAGTEGSISPAGRGAKK